MKIRRLAAVAALVLGAGLAVSGTGAASAARDQGSAASVTCRAIFTWQAGDQTAGNLIESTQPNSNWVTTDPMAANSWCQIDTGFTYGGFRWFEYSNGLGLCLTDNDSSGGYEDAIPCQGLASQQWTATGQRNCGGKGGNACEYILGNAYVVIHYGLSEAMTDEGTGYTVKLLGWAGLSSQLWWDLPG